MQYTQLRRALKAESKKQLNEHIEAIKNLTSDDMKQPYGIFKNNATKTIYKKYQDGEISEKQAKAQTIEQVKKEAAKNLKKNLDKITEIENAKDVQDLEIAITWKQSHTWGWNPTAYIKSHLLDQQKYNYYERSEGYATGCGYDKLSAAIASALNDSNGALKLLYTAEEKRLRKAKNGLTTSRRDFIGYGSGYGSMPYFEGGVGFGCQTSIFENLGFKAKTISDKDGFTIAAYIEKIK